MDFLGPLPAFNFYISLIDESAGGFSQALSVAADFLLGGFSECTGLESEIQIEDYRAGGQNDRVFRFPSRANYTSISLSRGIGFSEDLYLWHEGFLKGEGKRKNGMIYLANETRVPIKCWTFENGIPVKWSGPSLNATTSALAIEKLEIAHEKLTLTFSPGMGAAALAGAIGF